MSESHSVFTETWSFDGGEFRVHVQGSGAPLLLIHGIGPGTSIRANFSAVLPALARERTVYGIDLVGFGASPSTRGPARFDFALWVRQARAAVTRIGAPRVAVWGQSLGAAVALATAAQEPSVCAVVGTGSGGGAREMNAALERFWSVPATPQALREAMATAVFDASQLSEEQIADRFARLHQDGVAESFRSMMDSGKAQNLQSCWQPPETLQRVSAPVLLIHGRDDHAVPYRDSALHLLDHLPDARLMLLSRCGHNPMIERTDEVLSLALAHLNTHR